MDKKQKDIKAIFSEVIEKQTSKERADYLDEVCGKDAELRSKIEVLLKAHEQAGSFLEIPDPEPHVTLDGPAQIEGPGTKIGRYELQELIGEGGMGLVYLAQQKEPVKRRVALKIIKPGMDSAQVIARFEAERQALALLDHPNIAHVFDAGTTEAVRPYFVMEYVKGLSITAYCDQRKLNIEQRLRLFEQVCEAIHHAHQKGIIHRDIKPSNILVSVHGDRAVPKIIDFGIAKATARSLTDKTMFTFQGQLLGTPEYMSPEQVDLAIQDIDTRSDIYSLGVVLYELLAGVSPFETESLAHLGFAEVQRTIREQEPASPSIRLTKLGEQGKTIAASRGTQLITLARRLHRELEWIPLKAMRKDRCRRYRSASEMADDVRNYLNGLPLIAGPETAVYRAKKFVRKHAGSVTTVALVTIAVLLGLVASVIFGCRAEHARQQEATARKQVEQALARAENAERTAQRQRELAEEQAEEYRRSLYAHRINLAEVAYRDGDIGRLQSLLYSCPDDLRAWEWNRLNYISDQSVKTLRRHDGRAKSVSLSPDGRRIISAGSDGTITLWDAEDYTELMVLRTHESTVKSATFSPDSKRIASISRDNKIKVWDAQSGSELMTLSGDGRSFNRFPDQVPLIFSPDGRKIVSSSPTNIIKVWDADSGDELISLSGHKRRINGLAFTPDGKRIVSGSDDRTLIVWDTNTGQQMIVLEGHDYGIKDVALSPDGKRIVSGSNDRTAKVWDMATGAELMTLHGHDKGVTSVAFSDDGTRIATGGEAGKIKVWDAANGTELTTFLGHDKSVMDVAFSSNGKRIVSGSRDGTVKIWELETEQTAQVTLEGYNHVAFSPDGRRIVTSGYQGDRPDKAIRVWDAATHDELMKIEGASGGASFSPNGERIITIDGNDICVWDASSGKKLMTLSGHESGPLSEQQADIWSVSYSPDGTRIVSGGMDKTVRVWNAVTGAEIMTLRGHGEMPSWPEFSPVASVVFSPDGQLIASSSYDSTVKVWNAGTGVEVWTMRKHSSVVNEVAFSPDGKRLASASSDRTIRICDVATGETLLILRGHEHEVLSVAFSPDGKRIVSGSKDDTFRIWDAETGHEVQRFSNHGYVWEVCFSPDGMTLATVSNLRLRGKAASVTLWESAGSSGWEEAQELNNQSRSVIFSTDLNEVEYRKALEKLEKAVRLIPDDFQYLVALGVAQYRVGAYEDALVTLECAEKNRPTSQESPRADGYRAMALHKLGRDREAKAALQKLRNRFRERSFSDSNYAYFFLTDVIEVEKLFAGEDSTLNSIWELIEEGKLKETSELIENARLSNNADYINRMEGAIKLLEILRNLK